MHKACTWPMYRTNLSESVGQKRHTLKITQNNNGTSLVSAFPLKSLKNQHQLIRKEVLNKLLTIKTTELE